MHAHDTVRLQLIIHEREENQTLIKSKLLCFASHLSSGKGKIIIGTDAQWLSSA
jgi:hypothetical protein